MGGVSCLGVQVTDRGNMQTDTHTPHTVECASSHAERRPGPIARRTVSCARKGANDAAREGCACLVPAGSTPRRSSAVVHTRAYLRCPPTTRPSLSAIDMCRCSSPSPHMDPLRLTISKWCSGPKKRYLLVLVSGHEVALASSSASDAEKPANLSPTFETCVYTCVGSHEHACVCVYGRRVDVERV